MGESEVLLCPYRHLEDIKSNQIKFIESRRTKLVTNTAITAVAARGFLPPGANVCIAAPLSDRQQKALISL